MVFAGQQFWKVVASLVLITLLGQQCYAGAQISAGKPGAQRPASTNSTGSVSAQALFNKANVLIKGSKFAKAEVVLRSGTRLFPEDPAFHHYLGYVLWRMGHLNEAQAELEKAHALDPKNPYICYFLGRIAASLGHTDHAITYYREVLQQGSAIYDTNRRLAQAYLHKGDLQQARLSIRAAIKATPWDGSLYYQLGQIDQREHHLSQARQEFAKSTRLNNGSQQYIRQMLSLSEAVKKHQADRVEHLRNELLSENYPDPNMYDSIGVLLGHGGFFAQALEPLQRSVKLAPNSYQFRYDLGLTLFKLGRIQGAQVQLEKALALKPKSPEINRLLGLVYVSQNNTTKAIARLNTASKYSPGDTNVLALLGEQYLAAHYVDKAIPCLIEVIRRNPGNSDPYFLLIEAYQDTDNFQASLKVAQSAAARFPHSARFVYEEGQQLAYIGNYQKALPYAEKAIEMDPNLFHAYDLMGDIYSKSGHYTDALTNFRKARNIEPSNGFALKGIAESLMGLDRFPEALTELKRAIAVRPQDPNLYFDLIQVYMRLGKRQEAIQAQATFEKLHARAVAIRNGQAPRK